MNKTGLLLALLTLALPVLAQEKNPLSAAVRGAEQSRSKNLIAAAEQMPADKYGFKPTPEQMSFGHLVLHTAMTNNGLCSKIGDTAAPKVELKETDAKEKLVDALKQSFDFCSQVLAKADDSNLGQSMTLFGSHRGTRAEALVILASSWADHYGAAATYLRLNRLSPPTAKKEKD